MNPRIMQIAEKSGLSVATVTKIAGIIKKMGTHRLTAHDVARELGIAQRNGRRILALLEKAGVAVVEGLEQPVARGRPRKVYAVRL
jgi:predicted ArsR family transcriptional regulator